MTFPVHYDKFTIPSAELLYDKIYRRSNITHKPTSRFGGYFSSVTFNNEFVSKTLESHLFM